MSAEDDDRPSLWVGELEDGSRKLYLVKGNPAAEKIRGWQHIKPQADKPSTKRRILGGPNDSKEMILAAAITQARLLFDSADDLSNKDKTYPTWAGGAGRTRRLETGFPNFLFEIEPWRNAPELETEA